MKPAILHYGFGDTFIGPALAAWSERGLCVLRLMAHDRHKVVAELRQRYPDAELILDQAEADRVFDQVAAHLDGEAANGLKLDLHGTPFQRKVWEMLRRIPRGQTLSYQDVAQRIGKPRAVRAVGNACGANPVGLLIPCHRVVASDGRLGGFGWGLGVKQELLDREAGACTNPMR